MQAISAARVLARLWAALAVVPALAVAAGITAAPPVDYVAPMARKADVAQPALAAMAARVIRLTAPSAAELATLKARNATTARGVQKRGLLIGIGRELPPIESAIAGSDLAWTPTPDGGRVARIDVTSPHAAGIRVAVAMSATDPDVSIRFGGADAAAPIFGPYAANEIAQRTSADGAYWSPVIEGDTASIEVRVPSGVSVDALSLRIVRISHLVVAGAALRQIDPKLVSDIGLAGSCEIDVACIANPPQALTNVARSVAKTVFTDLGGSTATCTGTLISDVPASMTPYFYTANHCIGSQAEASTLNTYWFFDAVSCGSKAVPPYALRTGGAMLLGRSDDYDWSILRLNDPPPAGAQFSAWRAEPLAAGSPVGTMHHPEGDLKKWSQGVTLGYEPIGGGSFIDVVWNTGSTEFGSSGAGLFTMFPSAGYYELRGGLFGGEAACFNRSGIDVFSRLDKALPLMRQYLTPTQANPNGEVPVVEFYSAALDHYFISSNPAEINDLDTGVHPGWVRTGLRFLAYGDPAQAPLTVSPVCRFYLNPALGDSHFYSGDPAECAATLARFGNAWTYESASVFWIVLPDRTTGACPLGLKPVYRFFHSARTNHRYTTELVVRDDLSFRPGWIAEGYGPEAVIMCSPEQ